MAILEEILENGLIRHYSDAGKMILQIETGALYSEAIDVTPCKYTYEESEDLCEESYEISGEEFIDMIEGVL